MLEGKNVAIDLGKYAESLLSAHDPWELIESGLLRVPSISRATAGQKIPLTPETMKPGQLRLYNTVKKAVRHTPGLVMIMVSKYRQGGASSLVRVIFSALGMARDGYKQTVIADTTNRTHLMQKIDLGIQTDMENRGVNLRKYKTSNRRELIYEDSESEISYMSDGEDTVGISEARNGLHGTEMAYWGHWIKHWADINPSLHDLPYNLVILEGTSNGVGDAWHLLWLAAGEPGSGIIRVFLGWNEDPDLVLDAPEDWQPDEWEQSLVDIYKLTREQIYWYHKKLYKAKGFNGNKALMKEKYPFTWQESFQASGSIVMESVKDTLLNALTGIPGGKIGVMDGDDTHFSFTPDPAGKVEIIIPPVRGRTYCGYSDVGEGLKDVDDIPIIEGEKIVTSYSTCIIRDSETWELCAIMECRYPEGVFEAEARRLMYYYNTAWWGVEIPGPGRAVIAYSVAAKYPNMYLHKWRDAKNELREMKEFGYRNDVKTKKILESGYEEMCRDHPELIGSSRIAAQALTYVRDPKTAKHGPRTGCFSDLLLADMGVIQLLQMKQPATKEAVRKKIRDYQKQSSKKNGSFFR